MNENAVLEKVREQITRQREKGVHLEVLAERCRDGDGTWSIPVRALSPLPNISTFYKALSQIEHSLAEDEGLIVWLEPVLSEGVLPEFPWPKERQWQPPLTKKKLVSLAQERLRYFDLDGVTLEIIPASVTRVNEYWHAGVRPSGPPSDTYSFYEALAEVEADLEEVQEIPIQLHTAWPSDEDPVT